QNNLSTVSGLAHKMKPSLDNLGIVSLKEVIRQIEKSGERGVNQEEVNRLVQILSTTLQTVFEELRKQ
ncbi:MAG TPA: hypothetical protein PLK63_16665, partial [Catalimonadaceae bacterium]|nr:hypothetical protein [Catalimonadaceae bacterium]